MYADYISHIFPNTKKENLQINSFLELFKLYQYFNRNNLHGNADKSKRKCFPSCKRKFEIGLLLGVNDFELPSETSSVTQKKALPYENFNLRKSTDGLLVDRTKYWYTSKGITPVPVVIISAGG